MNDSQRKIISKTLAMFTPEERGALEAMAQMRVEHGVYQKQLVELKAAYDSLYAVMLVILNECEGKELRINKNAFLKFKAEYRIEQIVEAEELVLKLKTLTD